ncbi:DUF2254 domain-containing protein [Gaiella sp.]|uniref:DUF2254 domain-containing protein n=1 Tax=Gaiella sp. TaxID=2663207 RepID=UPI0032671E1B
MLAQLISLQDRVRSSLFVVPMLCVAGGVVLGELMLVADARVDRLPSGLTATVDSARAVLSVVASATLAFAGIAFSVSLLLISLSSSQYSPRIVHGLFRDPFNTRVMGIVVGTFTYCLVVLRAVRGPLEQSGERVVPNLAVLVALALGVVSVLAIIAFIDHAAHSMDVSKILRRATNESIVQVRGRWPAPGVTTYELDSSPPSGSGHVIRFEREGWVQHVDHEALLGVLDVDATLLLDTTAGRFAIPHVPFARAWPLPGGREEFDRRVRAAVIVGETRTMQQDARFGVRQLVDVALKALSPGINDPTTAQDAMFHLGAVLAEMLARPPLPRALHGCDGRRLLLPQESTHEELIDLAFDEMRIAAAGQPTVSIYLLELLDLLGSSLDSRNQSVEAALRRQAKLTLAVSERADLPQADLERVRYAYRDRFDR